MPDPSDARTFDPIPRDYAQWRRCIEVDCGLVLTPDFIRDRRKELADLAHFRTRQFIQCHGEPHRQRVLAWFAQAADDLGGAP